MLIKLIFSVAIVLFVVNRGQSQVVVDNTSQTPAQLVQNVLLGGGVAATNFVFNGGSATVVNEQAGSFGDVSSSCGLAAGIILGSGDVSMAQQPNIAGSSSLGGTGAMGVDIDLQSITPNQIYDEAVLEFDFVPAGDTLSFNYVFASEEYPEYVCSTVNDAFGFFLSGPNPSGGSYSAQNIALIPDPLVPGGYTTTPVSINTLNPGVSGSSGTASNCDAIDPNWAAYNVYYVDNTSGTSYEYDGRSVLLTAKAAVLCGETYHIKLAIGDGGDAVWDSGVFLEAGSFASDGVSVTSFTPFINNVVGEDCGQAGFIFNHTDTTYADTLNFNISGNAVMGDDYGTLPTYIIIPPGQTSDTLYVDVFQDSLVEGMDTITINLIGVFGCLNASIYIQSIEPLALTISDSINICTPMETGTIWANATGGMPPLSYTWDNMAPSGDTVNVIPFETTYYTVTVQDQCDNSISLGVVPVWVQCPVTPPNIFSPNGDGINDVFNALNLDDYQHPHIVVYNRWGKIVYDKEDYQNDWDGTHYKNGNPLSAGVYYFIIRPNSSKYVYQSDKIEGLEYTLTGNVTIVR